MDNAQVYKHDFACAIPPEYFIHITHTRIIYNHKDILINTERNTYTTTLGEGEKEAQGWSGCRVEVVLC